MCSLRSQSKTRRFISRAERLNILSALVSGFKFWKFRNIMADYTGKPEDFRDQMSMVKQNIPQIYVDKFSKMDEFDLSEQALGFNDSLNGVAISLCYFLGIESKEMEKVLSLMYDIYDYIIKSDDVALSIFKTLDYIFMSEWIDTIQAWNMDICQPLFYYNVKDFVSVKAEGYMIRAELNTIYGVFENKYRGGKLCHISDLEIPQPMKEAGFMTGM